MAPSHNVQRIPNHFSKGGNPPPLPHEVTETITQEPITTIATTIHQAVTTAINTVSSTVQEMLVPNPGGADSNTNNTLPSGQGGANEMSNSTNTDVADMSDKTFNQGGSGMIFTSSTGTSLEEMTTVLMDEMEHMKHVDESDEYNSVLFIVLGVGLGLLVIAVVVLAVVYNHYKKRGFEEITGDQSTVDPQSMKKLQQASSQDALLDK